jgi:DNA-binding HxlR family transcriptional regulator
VNGIVSDSGGAGENGAGNGALKASTRAGSCVLSLFAVPLNPLILRALAGGPMRLADLHKEAGSPAQTTLRDALGNLVEIGALERRRRDDGPSVVDNRLTELGAELLLVADALEAWLARSPEGPIPLQAKAAKGAIKALAAGWSSTMLRALAARPLSLTELDSLIASYSYPALERRLATMRLAGQVEALSGRGRSRPYAVTDWVRQGIAPLVAAIRCERRHMPAETAPITRLDVDAAFLLATPLVTLPATANGCCRLAVDIGADGVPHPAGVDVAVERGGVVSCVTRLKPEDPTASALGPVAAWFEAVIEGEPGELRIDGDRRLALALVDGLHGALFAP